MPTTWIEGHETKRKILKNLKFANKNLKISKSPPKTQKQNKKKDMSALTSVASNVNKVNDEVRPIFFFFVKTQYDYIVERKKKLRQTINSQKKISFLHQKQKQKKGIFDTATTSVASNVNKVNDKVCPFFFFFR